MKKKAIISLLLVSAIVLAIGGVTGCQKQQASSASSASSDKTYTLKIPNISSNATSVSPVLIAQNKGWFKEEGLEIQDAGVLDSAVAIASLESGGVTTTAGHANRVVAAVSAGAKIIAVAANSETTQDKPHMLFAVKKDSPIKTGADIVGKKLGVASFGGCNEAFPWLYLKEIEKISSPIGKFTTFAIPEAQLALALDKGSIDVAGFHSNPSVLVKNYPQLRILFSDWDIGTNTLGQAPWYMSLNFIKEHPDVVKRFVKVIARVNNYIDANPQEAINEYAKILKVDPAKVSTNYYAKDAIIKPETVQRWDDIMLNFGLTKQLVPLDKLYTNKYNPNFKG